AVVTHSSSVVAMTITLTGYDEYLEKVVETLTIAATGTSQNATGKKAMRYLEKVDITAAADAEANTLNLGTGDALGLPVKIASKANFLMGAVDGVQETVTVVASDATTPSATTGDVRGTVDFTTAYDGSKAFTALLVLEDTATKTGVFGLDQYAG